MIVKNEEKNITRALSWGKDIMWEQIVVDTGSTDRTVGMAKELGAQIYHFEWVDDFSAAKNYAIEQAKGDWIVFLDADEFFLPEDVETLRETLERLTPDGERDDALLNDHPMVTHIDKNRNANIKNMPRKITAKQQACNALVTGWIQSNTQEDILHGETEGKLNWRQTVREDGTRGVSLSAVQIRVFRNCPEIRYRGRIHEQLYMKKGELLCEDVSHELSIIHTGYASDEIKEKNKVERNIALIQKELEDHPNDYGMLACLGDSYFHQRKYDEAVRWYDKSIACMPKHPREDDVRGATIFKNLLTIHFQNIPAALQAYRQAVRRFPKDGDYDYLMAEIYMDQKQFQEGVTHLQKALALLDRYGSGDKSVLLSHNLVRAWELYVICLYETGDLNQCVSCAVTILKVDPRRMETLKTMLLAFQKDEEDARAAGTDPAGNPVKTAASAAQVKTFLGNLYDFNNPEDRDFVKKTAEQAGYWSLTREIK